MSKWSKEDTDWLINNRTKGLQYCADQLGRTYTAVSSRLSAFGVVSNPRRGNEIATETLFVSEVTRCYLPVFHPVMLGIKPVGQMPTSNHIWRKRRNIILKMHDNCCVYCGDEANTVDHVIPISKGGIDNLENLVAACEKCNYGMGNKTKHIKWIK